MRGGPDHEPMKIMDRPWVDPRWIQEPKNHGLQEPWLSIFARSLPLARGQILKMRRTNIDREGERGREIEIDIERDREIEIERES